MRTLLAQIYEAGRFHTNAVSQKRGLRDALAERGSLVDFDYLANDKDTLFQGFINRIEYHMPDLVLTQFHGADSYIREGVRMLTTRYPDTKFVNWSGDSWSWSLTTEPIMELASMYDLWLVAAPDVLPLYAARGINARFWQIGAEIVTGELPEMPAYDVVFLGNVISERRRELRTFLRSLPYKVGIYGDGDGTDGHNTYDFREGEALYRNAKVAIADAAYVDQKNYVSNRPLQIMAAGGAILLHQHVDKMPLLIEGIMEGVHYLTWQTFSDLRHLIDTAIRPDWDGLRQVVAQEARELVMTKHTYEVRVQQLMSMLDELE